MDWGHQLYKPLLSTFELHVVMGEASQGEKFMYTMDYYWKGGEKWTNYHEKEGEKNCGAIESAFGTRGGKENKLDMIWIFAKDTEC